jgi:hypothetical protein
MFISKWPLLVRVTLNASPVRASGEPGLLEFKATMRIVTIAALHRSFKNLMVEWLVEIRLGFTMTTHA